MVSSLSNTNFEKIDLNEKGYIMLFGKYLFSCCLQGDAILPEYKGSTLRGIFGHALKQVVCALKVQECNACLLREKCIYPFLFETHRGCSDPHIKKRIAAPPHPYVLEPPDDIKTVYRQGESIDFTLLLFGRANDYLPYFIYAFDQMGKLGIGKKVDGRRAAFILERVTSGGDLVYSHAEGKLKNGEFAYPLTIEKLHDGKDVPVNRVIITLRTPLRLKYENKLEASLPFHILVRAMLRRISSLCYYHGDGEPLLDYRGLVERARGVEIIDSSLRWFDWRRYSNRQDQAMLMGGITGTVTYTGALNEFLPLTRFCELTHLGKQTAFGLGKIEAK